MLHSRETSQPRHQRGMDHVLHAFAADRLDRQIDILQSKPVSRHKLQRKPLGGKLRERKLAGFEAVPTRGVHGDEFHRELLEWEIRKLRHLSLHHNRTALAFERLNAKQDRDRPGTGGAIERHVDALAASDLHDAREWVFLLHVDYIVRAK